METIGLISNKSFNDHDDLLSIYLNHTLNNGYDLDKLIIDSEIDEDEIIKKGDFSTLIKDFSFRNKKLLIFNSSDIANNLISLVENYIELNNRKIQVELINSATQDLLSDGLLRLGYLKPKNERQIKIAETIKLKSVKGSFLGRAPFGYLKSSSGGFIVDPDKSDLIKTIYNLYSGMYGKNDRIGLRKISKIIKAKYSFRELKWTPQSIKKILENRFYTGVYRRDLVIISDNHEPIITNEQFDFVQNLFLNSRLNFKESRPKIRNRNKILFKCAYCSYKLNKSTHHRKWKRLSGEELKKIYTYLNCENDQCNKVSNMRLETDKNYIDEQSENINNMSEFASYNRLVSDFKKNIKLVIRGRIKASNLKYDLERLKEYEKFLEISSPNNKYLKVIEVNNDFNKILTPV